jgi:hypothetical protein
MPTVLESLGALPHLRPEMIIRATSQRGPRIKKNPDGKMHHVLTTQVQSNKAWLIVITHATEMIDNRPELQFRTRVYLRTVDNKLIEIEDQGGFYTEVGAEWGAYRALTSIIADIKADRTVLGVIRKDYEEYEARQEAGL